MSVKTSNKRYTILCYSLLSIVLSAFLIICNFLYLYIVIFKRFQLLENDRTLYMRNFLLSMEFNSISFDNIINEERSKEIKINFDILYNKDVNILLAETFELKKNTEEFLKENIADYQDTYINISLTADYAPKTIVIANYDYFDDVHNKNVFKNCYDLHYGFFNLSDCDATLSPFRCVDDFEILYLIDFKDYSDVLALDSMSILKQLHVDGSIDLNYFKSKHPSCEII